MCEPCRGVQTFYSSLLRSAQRPFWGGGSFQPLIVLDDERNKPREVWTNADWRRGLATQFACVLAVQLHMNEDHSSAFCC